MIKDIFPIDDTVSSGKVFFRWCFIVRAISSGGERHLDTVEVSGSKPLSPTIESPGQKLVCFWLFVVLGQEFIKKAGKKAEIVLPENPQRNLQSQLPKWSKLE